ncbi:DUF3034 family protein [Pseudidiomarina marina]|uniref:DUF3034 family protein n=1 Tax=Pseudidiomarina marina TaxID=502366 RepID=UPI00384E17B2
MRKLTRVAAPALAVATLFVSHHAMADFGRIIATGGLTTVEGSGGGGLVPWATLSSYAEEGQWGGTIAYNQVNLDDYKLAVKAATISVDNRWEFSIAKQQFDLLSLGGSLKQDIYGIKYRLGGDVLYGAMPQFTVGLQHKRNQSFDLPQAVGAKDDTGTDIYFSGAKVWLDGIWHRTWLANVTLRATKANEMGLLGFGGDANNSYELQGEIAVGMFINRNWAVGVEYRQKPNNLGFAEEHDWYDIFIGWFPHKRIAFALAYTQLESIAGADGQDGIYGSLQVTF